MAVPPRVSVIALRTAGLARSMTFNAVLGWELSPAWTARLDRSDTPGSDLRGGRED